MSKIEKTFKKLKQQGKKAFIPYIMGGDPNLEKTLAQVLLLEECGADIIELGVPFSDPLADGPTIQRAAERALKAGVTLKKIVPFVKKLRNHSQIPVILMTYYNPVFKYGDALFFDDAAEAGVDGVIIPDLPPEEGENVIKSAKMNGLSAIFLVAPTSTEERIRKIVKVSSGFVYYVSITGTTGSRLSIDDSLKSHVERVKQMTSKPVAVGFGVSIPDDAHNVAQMADGVIVGSAIVKKLYEHPERARDFIKKLKEAIKGSE
jgi:tryptophan synthase alpha chain